MIPPCPLPVRFLATAAIAAFLGSAAHADDLKVKSVLLAEISPEAPLVLQLKPGEYSPPVTTRPGHFSDAMKFPRLDTWIFGYNPNGLGEFREICRTTPPPGDRVWLLFTKSRKNDSPEPAAAEPADSDEPAVDGKDETEETQPAFDVHAIGLDPKEIHEGGVAVVNTSPTAIEVEMNGKNTKVEPDQHVFVNPEVEPGTSYPVKFHFLYHDRMRPFVTTNWFRGKKRYSMAIVVPAGAGPTPRLLLAEEILDDSE